jgi:hypothetical protein
MAKKAKQVGNDMEVKDDVTLATLVLTRGDYTVKWADLPEKSKVRMATKAFNELMQDSTAFSKEQLKDKTAEEVETMKAEKRDARFNSILTGEFKVGGGGGARLPAIERVIREIAEERLKAIAVARKVPMPKGDLFKQALDKIIARDPDGIKVAAQQRIDAAAGLAADLGDIL